VGKAIQELDAAQAAPALLAGKPVQVYVEGIALDIQPDEVEVRADAHAGLTVASEGAYLAALHTELTPELAREGLAREFVRRVQDLRKQADFDIADRIRLYVQATPGLAEAIREHRDYIMNETLALELAADGTGEAAAQTNMEFDGERASVALHKVT